MATSSGTKTIITALLANFTVAVAKLFGFIVTASSSMLAEALHSLADTSNQVLLLFGKKKADALPNAERQFGSGRERFFWGFVVSLIVFSLGSLYAIYEGIHKIMSPEPVDSLWWALAILMFAMCTEGFAFKTAIKEAKDHKGKHSWRNYIKRAKMPELPVVLLEDFGALTGLSFAFICVLLADLTGNPIWDGIGTLGIGILLGGIAFILAHETKSLLIGEGALPEQEIDIEEAITSSDNVTRLIELRTEYVGPENLLIAAKVEFRSDIAYAELVASVQKVESNIQAVEPLAKLIFIEPDVA